MSEILKVKDFNKGAILKQGDSTTLKYYLYDADEEQIESIIGKTAEVVFIKGGQVYYRTSGVISDLFICEFKIEEVLPTGVYHIEFLVDGHIFPSGDKPYFTLTASSKGINDQIIKAHGFEEVVILALEEVESRSAERLADLEANYATRLAGLETKDSLLTAQLAEKANESDVQSLVANKAEKTYVDTALSGKRDKSTKIASTDLDTSSNAVKIKPINVSDELMTMFSPAGTVSPVIENGSVTTEKYADQSVTANKIASNSIDYLKVRGTWGVILGNDVNDVVSYNKQTKLITIKSGDFYFNNRSKSFVAQTIDISSLTSNFSKVLYFDFTLNQFVCIDAVATPDIANPHVIILTEYKNVITTLSTFSVKLTLADGTIKFISSKFQGVHHCAVSDISKFVLDFQSKKVQTTASVLINNGDNYRFKTIPNNASADFPTASPTVVKIVYYDIENSLLKVANMTDRIVQEHWILFYFDPVTRNAYPNCEGMKVIDSNGNVSYIETKKPSLELKELILPDKMYLTSGEKLPIYKSSIIHGSSLENFNALKTSIIDMSLSVPYIDGFDERIEIDDLKTSNTFKLGMVQDGTYKKTYKNITKVVGDNANLSGKSPKIMLIGDSLTHDSMAKALAETLNLKGCTPQIVGTFGDSLTHGYRSEGRGIWNHRVVTGASSIVAGNLITLPTVGATTTTKFQNPFLRIATQSDYVDHPDWCFRRTAGGSIEEKSYANDPDKTGDFYIFDFAWYLANRGIPTPDIVTIALSTNDIQLDTTLGAKWFTMAQLSQKIMIEQIKSAVPTVKIAVIPAPVWGRGLTTDIFADRVKQWIEHCISFVKLYSNVDLVPVWCHMNRDWGFDSAKGVSTLPGDTIRAETNDVIHFTADGRKEYVNVTTQWMSTLTL